MSNRIPQIVLVCVAVVVWFLVARRVLRASMPATSPGPVLVEERFEFGSGVGRQEVPFEFDGRDPFGVPRKDGGSRARASPGASTQVEVPEQGSGDEPLPSLKLVGIVDGLAMLVVDGELLQVRAGDEVGPIRILRVEGDSVSLRIGNIVTGLAIRR